MLQKISAGKAVQALPEKIAAAITQEKFMTIGNHGMAVPIPICTIRIAALAAGFPFHYHREIHHDGL